MSVRKDAGTVKLICKQCSRSISARNPADFCSKTFEKEDDSYACKKVIEMQSTVEAVYLPLLPFIALYRTNMALVLALSPVSFPVISVSRRYCTIQKLCIASCLSTAGGIWPKYTNQPTSHVYTDVALSGASPVVGTGTYTNLHALCGLDVPVHTISTHACR